MQLLITDSSHLHLVCTCTWAWAFSLKGARAKLKKKKFWNIIILQICLKLKMGS